MRRLALLLSSMVPLALAACEPAPRVGERVARTEQRFSSNEAVLVDFDIDGTILADTDDDATLRTLIGAQLLYSVGPLNAHRSVGRFERLEIASIARSATGEVTYHARLPVAWGEPSAVPAAYPLLLPARTAESDQTAFASKYGATCVDPEAGEAPIQPARMFLFYRPERAGCVLGTDDVVTLSAKVSPSKENTTGKYPEYDRIWDDGVLRVVAVFSRAEAVEVSGTDDEGVHAFYEFMTKATAEARALAPTALTTKGGNDGWSLAATLADGKKLVIDARIVGHELANEPVAFDAWYDARTPEADLIVYSGHAGLGWNVRTLMTKGTFRAGKYVVWSVNGCDTFAYVDRTLAARRALLNPDDPSGTKYLDVVTNVMQGTFASGPETTLTLIGSFVSASKSYRDIFADVDPSQVIVVTGEEDNVFQPSAAPHPQATTPAPFPPTILPPEPNDDPPASGGNATAPDEAGAHACHAAPPARSDRSPRSLFAVAMLFAASVLVSRRAARSR